MSKIEEEEGGEKEKLSEHSRMLEWRDYIAIPIAMLQTVLLPIVLVVLAIFTLVIIWALVF